jgi:ubiquinone/menaquinone biosynthesis C-methylase UbiE
MSGGYATLRRNLIEEIELRPGETILDVGCGSGVHDRAIVRRTNGENAITAIDINRYLLREARFLAEKEGVNSSIDFRAGDAESLPFDDDNFDVTFSITVIEEVDADRMLAEMVRVTKPGGRVGVVARSVDLPSIINLPLSPGLKTKLEAPGVGGGGVGDRGCADASLYHRFAVSGLVDVKMLPQLGASYRGAERRSTEENTMATLSAEELVEWRAAVAKAESEGTFFIARPYHCAVGTIPE